MELQNKNTVTAAPLVVDVKPPESNPVTVPASSVHAAPPQDTPPQVAQKVEAKPQTTPTPAVAATKSKPAKESTFPFFPVGVAVTIFFVLVGVTFYAYIKSK